MRNCQCGLPPSGRNRSSVPPELSWKLGQELIHLQPVFGRHSNVVMCAWVLSTTVTWTRWIEQCLKPVDDLGRRTLPRKPNQESSRPARQRGSGRYAHA